MSEPRTPRTPRTPRRGRDDLSSEFPSSPGLQYPSSPGIGASSPLPFASTPGFQVQYQPGQFAGTPVRRPVHLHGSEDVSSPVLMPSSPPMRSHLGSSNLRSDLSYGTPRDARG
ncbi:hypothetical protein BGX21_006462, partial [Mortierella sp. AD011]